MPRLKKQVVRQDRRPLKQPRRATPQKPTPANWQDLPWPPSGKVNLRAHLLEIVKLKPLPDELLAVDDDARFLYGEHLAEETYQLIADESDGIESHYDDDFEEELYFGIDFGTSTLKAVIRTDDDQGHVLAVPFRNLAGIAGYLLPTILYIDEDGCYTLVPTKEVVHSSIKLALMKDADNPTLRKFAVVFLALAIRQARAWFFNEFADEYEDTNISWEVRIGCPSNKDQDAINDLWLEMLMQAWRLAEHPGPITDDVAQRYVSEEPDPEDEELSLFRAIPEVFAAGQGYRRIFPPENRFDTDIIIVDIGSGTLDISAFAISDLWPDNRDRIGVFCCEVRPLGTSISYQTQLQYLHRLLHQALWHETFPDQQATLQSLKEEVAKEIGQALRQPLLPHYEAYCEGLEFWKNSSDPNPEDELANDIRRHLLQIRRRTWSEHFLHRDEVSRIQVILTGGGARSAFYRNAFVMDNGTMYKSMTWLDPKHLHLDKNKVNDIPLLRRDLVRPIDSADYDRLLVAYGLSIPDFAGSFVPNHMDKRTLKAMPEMTTADQC